MIKSLLHISLPLSMFLSYVVWLSFAMITYLVGVDVVGDLEAPL